MEAIQTARREQFVTGVMPVPTNAVSLSVNRPNIWSDMHPGVYKVAIACWVAFLAIFWITFSTSAPTAFALAICSFYATIFFGLPIILNRMGGLIPRAKGGLADFLRGDVDTIDGPISGMEALIQVILVPACLSIGGVAIGWIIHLARIAQ